MHMSVRTLLRSIVVVGLVLGAPTGSEANPVNWANAFLLQGSGGAMNPLVLVGFDPQPDPPGGRTRLSLVDPLMPELVREGQTLGTYFDVFFAISLPAVQLETLPSADGIGPEFGSVQFDVFDALGNPMFDVFFDVFSSSGGLGTEGVFLNPQPEVPSIFGFGAGSDGALNFTFTSFSNVGVRMRVVDAQGQSITFSNVPEPGTLALLGLGLAGLGLSRRRKA